MNETISIINMTEAKYFYKSPNSFVDYSQMQSFSLIKSCIEVFAYYKVNDFFPSDVRDFFEEIQIIQQKNNSAFVPSPKKVNGVLEYCTNPSSGCCLSKNDDGSYHIEKWDTLGYKSEIELAYNLGRIKENHSTD